MPTSTDNQKRTKITYLITKSNWGGAQRYVFDLASHIASDSMKEKYEVDVILGGNGPLSEKLSQSGIKVTNLEHLINDSDPINSLRVLFELIKIFRKTRPNIIHTNSTKIGLIGNLAGRFSGVKNIIFTAHGFPWNEDRGKIFSISMKMLSWITSLLSTRTIAVSESMKEAYAQWPFINKKTAVIYNGVHEIEYKKKEDSRSELIPNMTEENKKALWLGAIAELHPIKGYSFAIRAIKKLLDEGKLVHDGKKVIYVIIGEGKDREILANLIETLGLKEYVFLVGYKSEASKYLKAFDIFILPSLSEALGYVLLEAGLAGLPCITTSVGGLPEVIDDMKSGVVIQPRKSGEIASAIEFILNNTKAGKEYADALTSKVRERFSIEEMQTKTLALYETK